MNPDLNSVRGAVALVALLAACQAAQAQSAGTWLVRAGATHIAPDVTSGNLSASPPGTQVDVDSASQLTGGVTYMLSDNLAVDVPLGLPFKHDVVGAGTFLGGVGKLAETRALPATVIAQWRFGQANARWRPYVGAGLTYAIFYKERTTAAMNAATGGTAANPTTVKFDDRAGLTLQLGASFAINEKWFFDASVAKTFLKTTGRLSTGQTIDVKLDPLSVSIGLGMKF